MKVYIMSNNSKVKIEDLLATMARLRDPENGCPWDLEQTYDSLTEHTLEEAYEVIDAVDRKSMSGLKDELGDLLLQVVFYAQIASEEGHFDFTDVVEAINSKLLRRHPHIFGDQSAETSEDVKEIWDAVKKQEKNTQEDKANFTSVLEDVPLALPALQRIYDLDKKAAKVGFDWDSLESVFPIVNEELEEIKEAIVNNEPREVIEMEVSDLLTTAAVLARKLDINPERALQKGCNKFTRRFQHIEKRAYESGKPLTDYTVDEMMDWWREAKTLEKTAA